MYTQLYKLVYALHVIINIREVTRGEGWYSNKILDTMMMNR